LRLGFGRGAPQPTHFSLNSWLIPQYSHFTSIVSGGGGGEKAVCCVYGRWTPGPDCVAALATTMIMITMKNRKKMPPKATPGVPVANAATPPNKRNIMRRTSATMTPDRFCRSLNLSETNPPFYNNIVGVFITRQDLPESNLLRGEAGQDRPSTTMNILFLDRHIGCSLRLQNPVQRVPRRTALLGLGLLLQALPSTSN